MASTTAPGIFSGVLCSSAGRHCTFRCCQPFCRTSATSSRARAPQAMTRVSADTRAALRGAPLPDELLRDLDGRRRVAAIGVGADGLAEILVERRTADHDDVVVANAALLHRVDDDLHVGH